MVGFLTWLWIALVLALIGVMHGGAAGVIFGQALLLEHAPKCWFLSQTWALRLHYVLCREKVIGSVYFMLILGTWYWLIQLPRRSNTQLKYLLPESNTIEYVFEDVVIFRQEYWESTDTIIRLRSQVVQHGRTMALIRVAIESIDGETVYATCEHHKVNVPTLPEHIDARKKMRSIRDSAKREAKL
jgi:ribulose bisphosphate carboxylase small subunit